MTRYSQHGSTNAMMRSNASLSACNPARSLCSEITLKKFKLLFPVILFALLIIPATARRTAPSQQNEDLKLPDEIRSIDGSNNNLDNSEWGTPGETFLRITTIGYADEFSEPSGNERPNAREISNTVISQPLTLSNPYGASDFLWQWGQFLDHDITETPVIDPVEPFDIEVPQGDEWFDPYNTGEVTIALDRSFYVFVDGVRQQANVITAYIDGSNVYGSDDERATELRTMDGTGKLKTSEGNFLPFNIKEFVNAPSNDAGYFLAGDVRANEQVGLTVMHTLFVREHNYWAQRIANEHRNHHNNQRRVSPGHGHGQGPSHGPGHPNHSELSGDEIYQLARAIVVAELQAITYREFLPALIGQNSIARYEGYDPNLNPGISNVFATAAYRVGHTMLSSELSRLNARGETIEDGNISLLDSFFNPDEVLNYGLAPYLRGLATQRCQNIDPYMVDDVRNFLFGPPGAGGFDLASLNIQRGRDHGLPGFNQVRADLGLEPYENISDVSSDPEIQERLAATYEFVDDIDAWVGGLCEDHFGDGLVGETFHAVLSEQFTALRDGDRFWYQNYLPRNMIHMIHNQSLAKIIRRNSRVGMEIQSDVFRVPQINNNDHTPPRIRKPKIRR